MQANIDHSHKHQQLEAQAAATAASTVDVTTASLQEAVAPPQIKHAIIQSSETRTAPLPAPSID
jgi:hypothetical protein